MIDAGVDAGVQAVSAVADPSTDPGHFIEQTFQALQSHDYRVFVALLVIGLVWLVRRFGGKIPGKVGDFLRSDRGGAVLALSLGVLENVAHGALAGALTLHVALDGLTNGVTAAGGYVTVKKMLQGTQPTATVLKAVALVGFLGIGLSACTPALVATYDTLGVKARLLSVAADSLPGVSAKLQKDCVTNNITRADGLKCLKAVEAKIDIASKSIQTSLAAIVFVKDRVDDEQFIAQDPKDFNVWLGTALSSYVDTQNLLKPLGYNLSLGGL